MAKYIQQIQTTSERALLGRLLFCWILVLPDSARLSQQNHRNVNGSSNFEKIHFKLINVEIAMSLRPIKRPERICTN